MNNNLSVPPPDHRTFQAYRDWQVQVGEAVFPESELRNGFETNADGSMGPYKTPASIHNAIGAGAKKRNYSGIKVPILALFPSAANTPRYEPKNAGERAAIEDFDAATTAYVNRWKKSLQGAGARIVEIPGAGHYVFLTNEAEVLREIRDFVQKLL